MEIIDNFLDSHDFMRILFEIDDPQASWIQSTILSYKSIKKHLKETGNLLIDPKYNIQFCQVFDESHDFLKPLFNKLGVVKLHRCKVNLTVANENHIDHGFHVDISHGVTDCAGAPDFTTAILYLNDNNGYTEFKSGEKIESVQNRVVKFPNKTLHRGVSCTNVSKRLVMNINYQTQEQYDREKFHPLVN